MSNWTDNQGRHNPLNTASDFKKGGMTDTQAGEAARAAERARQQQGK